PAVCQGNEAEIWNKLTASFYTLKMTSAFNSDMKVKFLAIAKLIVAFRDGRTLVRIDGVIDDLSKSQIYRTLLFPVLSVIQNPMALLCIQSYLFHISYFHG
ncbi:MAG: hypothetical protein KKE12_05205, partial [Proteobacteria bacterium]|nr:hypothetical protein [Pseudomonadota bacterium]